MPNVKQVLSNYDPGLLKIIINAWGLEIETSDEKSMNAEVVKQLTDGNIVREFVSSLPDNSMQALEYLIINGGRETWAKFTRKFGGVREMGPAKRERERPYEIKNATAAEYLWYRGLIARAFFDTESGPEEFGFVPDDLLSVIPIKEISNDVCFGKLASQIDREITITATDSILDDACTLLAGLRNGLSLSESSILFLQNDLDYYTDVVEPKLAPAFLYTLFKETGIINNDGSLNSEATREFLEADRNEALLLLVRAWQKSTKLNELRMLPELIMEGDWRNNPLNTRMILIDKIETALYHLQIEDDFIGMAAFVNSFKENFPDFQRPSADYDSWYIRSKKNNQYLRGFESWDAVDGELIRFVISGPMHWLGITDLAFRKTSNSNAPKIATAFRISAWGKKLLDNTLPDIPLIEKEDIKISSNGKIQVGIRTPRGIRYQLSRFCSWDKFTGNYFYYQITPASLNNAVEQGLLVDQLIGLLKKNSEAVPPNIVKALKNWEMGGSQARIEEVTILRFSKPELLNRIRASRAKRFLGDPLGPTSVIVRQGAVEKILAELAEMGYLGEVKLN